MKHGVSVAVACRVLLAASAALMTVAPAQVVQKGAASAAAGVPKDINVAQDASNFATEVIDA